MYTYDSIGNTVKLFSPSGEMILLKGNDAISFLEEIYDLDENFQKIQDDMFLSSQKLVTIDELTEKIISCYF